MPSPNKPLLTVVVPVHNESENIEAFQKRLLKILKNLDINYELIYIDDGSIDASLKILRKLAKNNSAVKVLALSRNFGKEVATTAGINAASGHAILTIDADGQHPPELIGEFIKQWQAGHKVVVGLRKQNRNIGITKRVGSRVFYFVSNRLTGFDMVPNSTDFRLIDSSVQKQFKKMTERNRITRGLIDWLGYERSYIEFKANARSGGEAGYTNKKLIKLAVDSIISLSVSPLFIAAYIGAVVLPLSILIGLVMLVNALAGDPLSLNASGGAYVIVLILFLVGVLLVSQGIIGLYLSHIHSETQNRPLYVIDKDNSVNIS